MAPRGGNSRARISATPVAQWRTFSKAWRARTTTPPSARSRLPVCAMRPSMNPPPLSPHLAAGKSMRSSTASAPCSIWSTRASKARSRRRRAFSSRPTWQSRCQQPARSRNHSTRRWSGSPPARNGARSRWLLRPPAIVTPALALELRRRRKARQRPRRVRGRTAPGMGSGRAQRRRSRPTRPRPRRSGWEW